MKKIRIADRRLLWVVVLVVLVLLMMNFNNRMSELLRLNNERDLASTHVASLKLTEQTLRTQIAYATSDVSVEEWARQEGGMSRPGDVPIVPIGSADTTPVVPTVFVPTLRPVQNWEVWQMLFFGP